MTRRTLSKRYVVACGAVILLLSGLVFVVARSRTPEAQVSPLKLPLSHLNKDRLHPYRFVISKEIEPDTLDALGTKEYLQWVIQEPDRTGGRGRRMSLLVTYHTGPLDPILDTPMGQYVGPKLVLPPSHTWVAVTARGRSINVPVTIKEYNTDGDDNRCIVVECICATGKFCEDLAEAKRIITSAGDGCAYISKTQIQIGLDAQTTKGQAVESLTRLLQVVLPVLLEDHWPDPRTARKSDRSCFAATSNQS